MKHLLSAADLSYEDAILVLDTAKQLSAATEQGVGKLHHFAVAPWLTFFMKTPRAPEFLLRQRQSD